MQQLDLLADYGTKSYIVGSTNSLLLQQKDRYSDILINLDEDTINITSASLRSSLTLSAADRRWIDFITQSVNDTWDESNPGRPKTMGYLGSEEFIRLQFEEYLLSLISAVKCHNYLVHHAHNPKAMLPQVDGDPSHDFGVDWIEAWSHSENYRIWERYTDSHLFDIVEPKHPCAGGLTMDDIQRRLAEQVKEFHLDERFAVGKEVIGRNLQAGKERATTVFNKLYADMEALRESQRRRQQEQRREAEANGQSTSSIQPDQNGTKLSSKAGAYIGSWSSWVGEKRKTGWGRTTNQTTARRENDPTLPIRQIPQEKPRTDVPPVTFMESARPSTQESYQENIFNADSHSKPGPLPATVEVHSEHPNHAVASKFHEALEETKETPQVSDPIPVPDPAPAPETTVRPVPEMSTGWSANTTPVIGTETAPNDVAEAVADTVKAASTSPVSPW